MDEKYIKKIIEAVFEGKLTPQEATEKLKRLPFEEMDFATVDNHRSLRTGYPEVVFCQGKTKEQVAAIMNKLSEHNNTVFGTRGSKEQYEAVKAVNERAVYYETARIIAISEYTEPWGENLVAVVTAGTADIPVAEEAAVTAELLGNRVDRIYDVGVAGIHRLFAQIDRIRAAKVVIVVAGMEGALASVVGGLIDKPVIAVPTSIGYGSGFGGLAALLSMLNSCANGITVVNVDNGFGAGYAASVIIGVGK